MTVVTIAIVVVIVAVAVAMVVTAIEAMVDTAALTGEFEIENYEDTPSDVTREIINFQ